MKIIDLEQNTPEWLAWRRTRLMASDAGSAAKQGYKTWEQLKATQSGQEEEIPEDLQKIFDYGHEMEEVVRSTPPFDRFVPKVIEDGVYGASLDGLFQDVVLEVKSPYTKHNSKIWRLFHDFVMAKTGGPPVSNSVNLVNSFAGLAPPYILFQMIQQAQLSQCKRMLYLICMGPTREDMFLSVIDGDKLRKHWLVLEDHWNAYIDWRDGIEGVDPHLFQELIRTRKAKLAAEDEYAAAEQALFEVMGGTTGSYTLDGVTVSIEQRTRRGGVDWKELAKSYFDQPDLENIQDQYRRPDNTYTQIKVKGLNDD